MTTTAVSIARYPAPPTTIETRLITELAARIEAGVDRLAALLGELPELNEALAAAGLKPFPAIREIER